MMSNYYTTLRGNRAIFGGMNRHIVLVNCRSVNAKPVCDFRAQSHTKLYEHATKRVRTFVLYERFGLYLSIMDKYTPTLPSTVRGLSKFIDYTEP